VLDPDEKHIIYQLDQFHGFKVRDVATGEITKSVELPPLPSNIKLPDSYPYTVDHGLGVTPDGTKLLAAASLAGYVAVYALPTIGFSAPSRSAKIRTGSNSGAIRRLRS
jgi:hypothetical protein